MNVNPISIGAAPLVAAALGRVLGIKVEMRQSATTAMTDKRTIVLPWLPVTLPESIAKILWGFIHHEAGHCRHTDFDVRVDNLQELQSDPLLNNLLCILEDIRMERAHIRYYPGAARILAELVEALVDIGFFNPLSQNADVNTAFHDFVLKHLRCNLLGQAALQDQSRLSRAYLERELGVGFVTRLVAELQPIMAAVNTTEALNLAHRIRQFLKDELEAQQQPPSQPQGGDDQSSPASADDDASSDTSTGAQQQEVTDDESNSGETGTDDCQDQDDGANGQATSDNSGDQESNAEDALRQILTSGDLDDSLGDLGDAVSDLLDESIEGEASRPVALPKDDRSSTGTRDRNALVKARSVSSRLAIQLRRQLESRRDILSEPTRRGKRIARQRLHRVAFKDYRVFQHKETLPEINTAVVSLIDVSSSMRSGTNASSRRPIDIASEAVLATSLALGTIPHLAHSVGAFPSKQGSGRVQLVQDFAEKVEAISSRFALSPHGCTPLAEAALWAGNRLLQRDESRRIIFVATDGDPDDVSSTKEIFNHLHRLGIEVHGLGIQSDDPNELFDSFVTVDDLENLPQAFLALFQRLLRRSA